MEFSYLSCRRVAIATLILADGLATVALGVLLELRNPRTSDEDIFAIFVLALGMFLIGLGASLPFARLSVALFVAFLSPFWAYAAVVAAVWGYIILMY